MEKSPTGGILGRLKPYINILCFQYLKSCTPDLHVIKLIFNNRNLLMH